MNARHRLLVLLSRAVLASVVFVQPVLGSTLDKVDHIVVIYLENHSFDNLYGLFPGAEGIAQAGAETQRQIDSEGRVYSVLPRVLDTRQKPPRPDTRFPDTLPNRPFEIGKYVPTQENTGDLTHRFYQHQAQINGGKMNRFAAVSDAGGLTMGYYDGHELPLWQYARRYTLADHFFSAAYGGSFLNHFWLACACTPKMDHPSKENMAVLGQNGRLVRDGALSPDGYAVNTVFPAFGPSFPQSHVPVLTPQTLPTIGDRLSEAGVDWAWYAGGWNDAVAGRPDPSFQFHHQPYTYFRRYADNAPARRHLRDETDFLAAIDGGWLPPVSFYKPLGRVNEHPGYADILSSERHIAGILEKIEKSPQWSGTVVIVTYDEFGGFWDHVRPPKGDRWGPGQRVPAIIVSPFSRGGHIDHRIYDTTSILRFIEERFGLKPLGQRDAAATSLSRTLGLTR